MSRRIVCVLKRYGTREHDLQNAQRDAAEFGERFGLDLVARMNQRGYLFLESHEDSQALRWLIDDEFAGTVQSWWYRYPPK